MSSGMVQIVDASVAFKWFVEEEGVTRALEVLERLVQSPEDFAVPEIFFFELVHTFNRLVGEPSADNMATLKQLFNMDLRRFSMDEPLFQRTRKFQALGLSGYDAAYVAIAEMIRGKWLTFDRKAHQKIAHLGLSELLA